jgi:hypothetical protein
VQKDEELTIPPRRPPAAAEAHTAAPRAETACRPPDMRYDVDNGLTR